MKNAVLVNRCLLGKLSVSCFIGNPRDKKLTQETEDIHGTDRKRLSVRKRIMQGDALNACLTTSQALRKDFERLSLPWFDGGFRLIPSAKFVETKQALDKRIEAFNNAVNAFIGAYDSIISADKKALGGTFEASDYPTKGELLAKFSASLEFSPLPVASSDWRIAGIDAQTAKNIAKQVEEQTAQRLKEGQAELLSRTREAIEHLAAKIADKDKRFKTNSIANVIEAAKDIDGLNVTENKKLSDLAASLADKFVKLDAENIREDETKRAEAVALCESSLADIEKTLEGIF